MSSEAFRAGADRSEQQLGEVSNVIIACRCVTGGKPLSGIHRCNRIGAMMVENEDDGLRDISQCSGQKPLQDGVVVYLSAHRRWRCRGHAGNAIGFPDEAMQVREEGAVPEAPTAAEIPPMAGPLFWPEGILALLMAGLLLGLCGALVVTIRAQVTMPVLYY